jgi:hypothetical protein
VAVADVNGDGSLDLVAVSGSYRRVSVLIGASDGAFASAVSYPVGQDAWDIAVGDVNGDGSADVVVANFSDSTVSILVNHGDGHSRTTSITPLVRTRMMSPSVTSMATATSTSSLPIRTATASACS